MVVILDAFDLAIDDFRREVGKGVKAGLAITLAAKKFNLDVTELRKEMSRRSASKRSRLAHERRLVREKLAKPAKPLKKAKAPKKVLGVQLDFTGIMCKTCTAKKG